MFKFFIIFIIIQLALFSGEQLVFAQNHFIIPFTELIAKISAFLIQSFDDKVISQGIVLSHVENNFSVAIQSGCNGIEAVIVLIAAMLAFPTSWQLKLKGILIGFFAVEILNIIRIISLFYIGQWDFTLFEWAHLYVWEALIMLDVLIVFLFWLRLLPARPQTEIEGYAE